MHNINTSLARRADQFLVVCCVIFMLLLLYDHFMLATIEVPIDYMESSALTITQAIATGGNPYTLENQPARFSLYTPLYYMVVAPFSLIFSNNLILHRAVAGVFILAASALCYLMAYRESNSRPNSFAAALIFYAGLLYFTGPSATPNGIGVFIFLFAIMVPWLNDFSNRSLCLAMILGILAFYGKQYFVVSLGFIASYLFLAVSKKKAIIFSIFSLTFFLISVALVNSNSPYFLDDTIFLQRSAAKFNSHYIILLMQLKDYGLLFLPIFIFLGVRLIMPHVFKNSVMRSDLRVESGERTKGGLVNISDFSAPFINIRINYIWYCFACSLSLFVISLGKSAGNHLVYLFQLVSPFLLAGYAAVVSREPKMKWISFLATIAVFFTSYSLMGHEYAPDQKNWGRLRNLVSEGDAILASPLITPYLIEMDKKIYVNGYIGYYKFSSDTPEFLHQTPPEPTPAEVWSRYCNDIDSRLEAQEFDLVMIDFFGRKYTNRIMDLLHKYYFLSEVIDISIIDRPGPGFRDHKINVWRPLKEVSKEQVSGVL